MAKVINFSDAAAIGIHSMILIAKSETPLNAIYLSEKISFSKHHIAKVLQRLVKDGYLVSFRGPKGGFLLKKKPSEILIYDIYRSIVHDPTPKCALKWHENRLYVPDSQLHYTQIHRFDRS